MICDKITGDDNIDVRKQMLRDRTQTAHFTQDIRPHLSTRDVNGCDDVSCLGIEASYAAGHGGSHQVLTDVQLHQRCSARL